VTLLATPLRITPPLTDRIPVTACAGIVAGHSFMYLAGIEMLQLLKSLYENVIDDGDLSYGV